MGRTIGVSILREMSKDTWKSAELVTKQRISAGGQDSYRLAQLIAEPCRVVDSVANAKIKRFVWI